MPTVLYVLAEAGQFSIGKCCSSPVPSHRIGANQVEFMENVDLWGRKQRCSATPQGGAIAATLSGAERPSGGRHVTGMESACCSSMSSCSSLG